MKSPFILLLLLKNQAQGVSPYIYYCHGIIIYNNVISSQLKESLCTYYKTTTETSAGIFLWEL